MRFDRLVENELSREDRIKAIKKAFPEKEELKVNVSRNLANGTGLMGYIMASYNQVVQAFGQPFETDEDKTTIEWVVEFYDGEVATIYDWWTDQASPQDFPDMPYHWHIGGHHPKVVYRVDRYIGTGEVEIASHVRNML